MKSLERHRIKVVLGALAVATISLGSAGSVSASLPDPNVAPIASNDSCATEEDVSALIAVGDNDVDPDSALTVVEIDGQPLALGGSVTVFDDGTAGGTVAGTATANADGTVTFAPDANYSGNATFTYTVAELVASGSAGVSYHLESTTDNGPVVFVIDLASGTKVFLGQMTFGSTTAMAYDDASGMLYFIRANGDLYGWDPTTSTTTAALVADLESATSGWTDPVPAAYSHQTASFYNGSLYFVPTARPAPALDDVLYRVDFSSPTAVSDVVKVADMSGDTVEWNNNDDMAIDQTTGVLYGRSDRNDQANSQRSSFFYSYDLTTGTWNMIIQDIDYAHDYVTASNNPSPRNDYRDASIGLTANSGRVFGTRGSGEIGELDPTTGAWTSLGAFVPDDSDLSVGGDLAHHAPFLRSATAAVSCVVAPVNDPPMAADDVTTTPAGTAVSIDPLAGSGADSDVDGSLDPTTVTFVAPPGATINSDGSVTVTGVGTWQVDPMSGVVTFTPEATFSGTASIDYTVADDSGLVSAPAAIAVQVATPAATSSTSTTSTTAASTTRQTTDSPGRLAFTGSSSSELAVWGSVLVAVGALLTATNRRRAS